MADQLEPPFKRVKPEQEEPEESGVKLNDLPELPFELILSYLSLEDRIKSRAVSRRWYNVINSFGSKSLCFLMQSCRKNRRVTREFAQNFIGSTKFGPFFQTFGQSILANLKHLRICNLLVNSRNSQAFVQALNSVGQLESLDIIRFQGPALDLKLTLPMLNRLLLEDVWAVKKLILDSPNLQNAKILSSGYLRLDLFHSASVERLVIDRLGQMEVNVMKNLKYLCTRDTSDSRIDSTFLSDLEQLKEIHLYASGHISELFEQKRRYDLVDLKIFLCGLLLDGPNDPAIGSLSGNFSEETLARLAANPSRLAHEIPLTESLDYSAIERAVPRESEIGLLERFANLSRINVKRRVQDIERFLQILKNMDNLEDLRFECDQPQDLFDRLPELCATLQFLTVANRSTLCDFSFLPKLKNLTELIVNCSIDIESARKILEGLQSLWYFQFSYLYRQVNIEVKRHSSAKRFKVYVDDWETEIEFPDLDAAIRFIVENVKEEEDEE